MGTDAFRKNGKFLMLALDHRGSFKKLINPENADAVSDVEMIEVKGALLKATAEDASGFLIDPGWGLSGYKAQSLQNPYLLSIEKTGYESSGVDRKTILESSAAHLLEKGAKGVKLLLYFNPAGATAAFQIEVAKEVLADCRANNLPLFLEIVTYDAEGKDSSSPEAILASVKMFLDAGVSADVFKLEYPGSGAASSEITAMLGETPWILLTRGVTFAVFTEQLSEAIKGGAQGFLAGRALWQEALPLRGAQREAFIATTVKERFKKIAEIAVSN